MKGKYTTWDRAMKLLEVDAEELRDLIFDGLAVYKMTSKLNNDFSVEPPDLMIIANPQTYPLLTVSWGYYKNPELANEIFRFMRKDVENMMVKNLDAGLSSEERRELGRLRTWKNKIDKIIEAAVSSGFICNERNKPITQKQLWADLKKHGCGDDHITTEMFNKIWKSLPQEYRKGSGRPKTK